MQALAIEAEYGINRKWLLEGKGLMDAAEAKKLEESEQKSLPESSVNNLQPSATPKWYDPLVPLEELTEDHLWLGGSSTPKTIIQLIERLVRAERRIEELSLEVEAMKHLMDMEKQ